MDSRRWWWVWCGTVGWRFAESRPEIEGMDMDYEKTWTINMGAIHTFRNLNSIIGIGRSKLIITQFQNQKVSCNETYVDQFEAVYCRRRSGLLLILSPVWDKWVLGVRRRQPVTDSNDRGWRSYFRIGEEPELRKTISLSPVHSQPSAWDASTIAYHCESHVFNVVGYHG